MASLNFLLKFCLRASPLPKKENKLSFYFNPSLVHHSFGESPWKLSTMYNVTSGKTTTKESTIYKHTYRRQIICKHIYQ